MSLYVIAYGALGLGLLVSGLAYFFGRATGRENERLKKENKDLIQLNDAQKKQFIFLEELADRTLKDKEDYKKRVKSALDSHSSLNELFEDAPHEHLPTDPERVPDKDE